MPRSFSESSLLIRILGRQLCELAERKYEEEHGVTAAYCSSESDVEIMEMS